MQVHSPLYATLSILCFRFVLFPFSLFSVYHIQANELFLFLTYTESINDFLVFFFPFISGSRSGTI